MAGVFRAGECRVFPGALLTEADCGFWNDKRRGRLDDPAYIVLMLLPSCCQAGILCGERTG